MEDIANVEGKDNAMEDEASICIPIHAILFFKEAHVIQIQCFCTIQIKGTLFVKGAV